MTLAEFRVRRRFRVRVLILHHNDVLAQDLRVKRFFFVRSALQRSACDPQFYTIQLACLLYIGVCVCSDHTLRHSRNPRQLDHVENDNLTDAISHLRYSSDQPLSAL
jgi:hypothetical protein